MTGKFQSRFGFSGRRDLATLMVLDSPTTSFNPGSGFLVVATPGSERASRRTRSRFNPGSGFLVVATHRIT